MSAGQEGDSEWLAIATLMEEMAGKLPDTWNKDPAFALVCVERTAKLVMRLRAVLPLDDLNLLIATGGVLFGIAKQHGEYAVIERAFLERARIGNGGLQ